jgi:hypothetical protein
MVMKGTPLEVIPGILVLILLVGCIQLPPSPPEKNESTCTDIYSPACGINNLTYQNSCYAQKAGITIAYYGECKKDTATCLDSDAGNNVLEAGNTSLNSLVKSDVCINFTHINEYYCSNNQIANETKSCPSGYQCSNDRCRKDAIPAGCYDTDNGIDYTMAGAVHKDGEKYSDTCILVELVKEYYCQNGVVSSTNIVCPSGYQCTNGACIEEKTICSDNDFGKDVFSKGTTTISKGYLTFTTATDDCVDEDRVREYFCTNGALSSEIIECGEDYGCDNGACKTLSCTDGDYGQDVLTKSTTKKGSISETDSCSGTYNVREYYCKNNDIKSTIITCPSGRICSSGQCIIDAPCSETDAGNDIYDYGTTTKGAQSNSDYCSGTSIVEYYCSNNNIQSTSTSCPSGYSCQSGECVIELTCADSDGGMDYNTKGTITKGRQSAIDYCQDANVLNEYYCDRNQILSTTKTCTYGCDDGKCNSLLLCSETDGGKDYLTKGSVRIGANSATDQCIDGSTIQEYYCTPGSYSSEIVQCGPFPYVFCSNGACISIRAQ